MLPSAGLSVFFVLLTVSAGLVVWALMRAHRRGREMQRAGARLGLRYSARGSGLAQRLASIPSIATAPHQRFSHVLEGPDELVCDWSTIRPHEKRRRSRHQTIVAIRRPGAGWPSFRIVPRDIAAGRLESFTGERLGFPEESALGGHYRVEALDVERVWDLLGGDDRLASALPDGLVVEGGEDWLVAYRPLRRLPTTRLASLRERLRTLGDRLAGASADRSRRD